MIWQMMRVKDVKSFVWITWTTQLIWLLTSGLVIFFQADASMFLQTYWTHARTTWIWQLETFEPLVASLGFLWCVATFRIMDRMPMFQPYKFNAHMSSNKKIKKEDLMPPRHAWLSLVIYLVPLLIFDVIYPRRALPAKAPVITRLCAECIASLLIYDFLFFWIHLALHKFSALRWIHHSRHHTMVPLNATEVVRHSFCDGLLQVSVNIVTLNLLQMHPLSRACHNLIVTYLLTEAHSGYDLPFMLHNVLPFGIFGGPILHEKHHRDGTVHYQQFFTYLDRSLGYVTPHKTQARSFGVIIAGLALVGLTACVAVIRWLQQLPHVQHVAHPTSARAFMSHILALL